MLETIGIILWGVGMIGLVINVTFHLSINEVKHHIYSTIPAVIGLMIWAISIILKFHS